jgi:hypothetical protein
MLWKQLNPRYRKLMRDGLKGAGLIVDVKEDRLKGQIGGLVGWHVTLRVKFADGSSSDLKRYVEASVLTDASDRSILQLPIAAGKTLPIRVDPKNRSRVEIDTAALTSGQAAQRAHDASDAKARQDAAVQQAEQDLKPIDS